MRSSILVFLALAFLVPPMFVCAIENTESNPVLDARFPDLSKAGAGFPLQGRAPQDGSLSTGAVDKSPVDLDRRELGL